MKANEFRVGNLVYVSSNVDTLTKIADNDYCAEDFGRAVDDYMIDPIPLTEEWLINLGFEGRVDFKWIGIVGVQKRDNSYYMGCKDLSNVIFHSVVEIKYVHQLQNLYFALTGEELTLTK